MDPAVAASDSAAPLLSVETVSISFGGVAALRGVSFEMRRGEILGLIGPNGAGKTTLFNCISRLYEPSAGRIRFLGRDLLAMSAAKIAPAGIGRTFQNVAAFATLSVRDNIRIGAHCRGTGSPFSDALRLPGARRSEETIGAIADDLIALLDLGDVAATPVKALPFGLQKRVELARALASGPQLLLLDEPAAGLNHEEVEALGGLIRHIRDGLGVSVLLVEHHMRLVMSVSDRIVVLSFGQKIAEGTPAAVQDDPRVAEAYLGSKAA